MAWHLAGGLRQPRVFHRSGGVDGKAVEACDVVEPWSAGRSSDFLHDHGQRKHRGGITEEPMGWRCVVRNMPRLQTRPGGGTVGVREAYGVPTDLPIALMQGAYMDRDRGAAEAVAALPGMKGIAWCWWGRESNGKRPMPRWMIPRFESRLHCIPKLPFEALRKLTASADVGLSLGQGRAWQLRNEPAQQAV